MGEGGYYFERLGEDFDRLMSDYDVERRTALIRRLLPADAIRRRCLEVGSGTGRISRELKPLVAELVVSDVSAQLARTVGEKLGVSWRQADACRLGFPDASFDLVVSSECIEHTPDPRLALREMARVLLPGGALVVTSPNKLWFPVLQLSLLLGIRKFEGPESWLFPWQAAAALRVSGLRVLRVSGCHLFPWQVPGAKRVLPVLDRIGDRLYPLMINFAIAAVRAAVARS